MQVKNVRDALMLFEIKYGRYPTDLEGLDALIHRPEGRRPIMEELPQDPWGHQLIYRAPSSHRRFELYSLGPDGADGTMDDIGRCQELSISGTSCPDPWPK